ncbi:SMC family ATPase [Epilithonimonas sp. JDS]|uniref:SbcC/MukB-like Walker B domain-containing protein n=1 Tax=Epilithonimonas sp. JDS TaxID=2902797 RepID=UPI001E2882A4|nr:SMC family ATPase [Epilithonimonas sp. JDS]MCD9853767.1 SMC family ATPase [Epilithonimonas sp. JDS]
MLPIKLTIEGLYSYQTRQTIDFSELTQAGLFGIFGAVGSGKSSILEAVSFALYGETERMNSKDSRAYNMMNLRSNRSFIEFDFQNYENRTFRAVREFRRNAKRFDDVKVYNTCFYEEKNGEWIPLEHTNASEILGLSYENFKRTIIIPQGQFKEFLELGAKDRTQMMKEIFGLHKYDLQDKVSTKVSETKYELAELEGKLGTFEEVSEELINQKSEELNLSKINFGKEKEVHNQLEVNFQKLKNLKTDFDNLKIKEAEFVIKETENEKFQKLEQQLEVFETAERNFKSLLTEKKRLSSEINQNLKTQESTKIEFDVLSETLNQLKQNISALENDFNQLENSKQKAFDLLNISRILDFETQKNLLLERIEKGEKTISDSKQKEIEILKIIDIESKSISDLKSKKTDTKILMEVENWFQIRKNYLTELSNFQKNILSKSEEIAKQQILLNEFPENWKEEFSSRDLALNEKKLNHQNQKSHLELSQKLAEFAQNIEDGKPCPLCGSLEHPEILVSENVSGSLKTLNAELLDIEELIEKIKTDEKQIEKILELKQLLENQKIELENQKSESDKKLKLHSEQFIWNQFDKENETQFSTQKTEAFALEQKISSAEKLLDEHRSTLENQQKETKRFEEAIVDFKNKKISLETSISDLKQNLKVLDFRDFETANSADIKIGSENLSIKNSSVENQYKQFQKDLLETTPKVASKETLLVQISKQIEELQRSEKENIDNIESILAKSSFTNLEEVEIILSQDFDIQTSRKEIQDFKISFNTLKEIINSLKLKLKESNFDESEFVAKENDFLVSQENISQLQKQLTIIEKQLSDLQKSFETKKDLILEQNKLSLRKANLDTLSNLFKGAGFVQYVSSIYLKQLCDNANVRFYRMTRNQLSLQVNDKNEFEIIDYLNEGKTRSVKTLSGGQSFQVSLSLALALAESVQSQAKSERNFFFIDEGFGTQDPESVNLVFETLMNLQKENRIVGIISHVEELKEKIPMSLNITKDEETGSKIEMILS